MLPRHSISTGDHALLGATLVDGGTNFALFSEHAEKVELCLFSKDGKQELERLPLPGHTDKVWHGLVPCVTEGHLYGYRVYGPHAPHDGHRFNPNKLLIDPYTKLLAGDFVPNPSLFGFDPNSELEDLSFSEQDSAPFMPKSVVGTPTYRWRGDKHPRIPRDQTILYEAHVKGQTVRHKGVAKRLRGTFEGLSSPAMLDHLTGLGVTSIELLPVQAFFSEPRLTDMGLSNYWGYNPIAYFAPHAAYMGPAGEKSFQKMVRALHTAGIEVILDVVYNHTAESWHLGPTLSFRGIDNASYYRLREDDKRFYVNDTGCGNCLNMAHPTVLQLTVDSLRYWVETMRVDGFRFDLGTTMARGEHGFDPHGPFLNALRQDPILNQTKLIMEPWDIGPGGYQLGHFPTGMAEWNDRYRDAARRYWRGDENSKAGLAGPLLGSADTFDHDDRPPQDSVNFITSHDGFTLRDLVSYAHKHNDANGEENRDGHHENLSDNLGHEGPTDKDTILARRAKRSRNLLATLLLSQGTPMLLAGDEIGHSQQGNNNAYCQDNETTWLDWTEADEGLTAFMSQLIALRKTEPLLRQTHFLHGDVNHSTGARDICWWHPNGHELAGDAWHDPLAAFGMILSGNGDQLMIILNAAPHPLSFQLPSGYWTRLMDTSRLGAEFEDEESVAGAIECPAEGCLIFKANINASADVGEDTIQQLSNLYGILPGYNNLAGDWIPTPQETQKALLAAMSIETQTIGQARKAIEDAERAARRLIPFSFVTRQRGTIRVPLSASTADTYLWRIELEDGLVLAGTGAVLGDCLCIDTDLPLGYHRLSLNPSSDEAIECHLIVAPQEAYQGDEPHEKQWGLMVPLYGLSSARNWGIGDFEDLSQLAVSAARQGASFIGLNPVHTLFPDNPAIYSPYSPSSREFLNVMHIAPDQIPELRDTPEGQAFLDAMEQDARYIAVRDAALVDYGSVYALKMEAFEAAFNAFQLLSPLDTRRHHFDAFVEREGQALLNHALYEALAEKHGPDWQTWPSILQGPDTDAATAFKMENGDRVAFFAYLQWIAAQQLSRAQEEALKAGMAIGLYLDIAVGMVPGGAEVWATGEGIADGVSLGAPGDAANPDGQMWHLAPLDPKALQQSGYRLLRKTLRATMRFGGMTRIDHILGINRSYWCPLDHAGAGGYVSYPRDAMLGIIALESHRSKCRVVGEDLGMVPEGFRDILRDWGLMGCSLTLFEKHDDGTFKHPNQYEAHRLAALSNHDFPTVRGFWEGADFRWREELGIGAREDILRADRQRREAEKQGLLALANWEGPAPVEFNQNLNQALHHALATGTSRTIALQLEDLLGLAGQPNVPGTTTEQPNWRRKIPVKIDELWDHQIVIDLVQTVETARKQHKLGSGQ